MARVPSGALSIVAAPIADRLFRNAAARLPLRMVYPDGTVVGAADPTLPTMVIHQPERLARRIGRYGLIGFGESYMAGEWSSDDLAGVLTEFANSMADLIPRSLQRLRPIAVVRQPRSQFNSREQARRNISEHYDLSNELFAEFLDETLTYSSALFDTLPAPDRSWPTPSGTRSTACSTPPRSAPAVGYSRSAPAGASCASVPRRAAHSCGR